VRPLPPDQIFIQEATSTRDWGRHVRVHGPKRLLDLGLAKKCSRFFPDRLVRGLVDPQRSAFTPAF